MVARYSPTLPPYLVYISFIVYPYLLSTIMDFLNYLKRSLSRLNRSKRGNVMNIIAGLAIISIGLGVISMVTSAFYGNIDQSDMSADANDSLEKVEGATWGGLSMATVIPYVLIGVGVIGLVIRGFGGMGD